MCLNHIIAHETYLFFHALHLKFAPTCFIKQWGTSTTQEFEYTWWSKLQIMLNVQYNRRYMSHVNYIEHVQIKPLIFVVKIVVRRFASHIFDIFHKKWRQVKSKRRQENEQTWYSLPSKNALSGHISKKKISTFTFWMHGHSSRSTFGFHLVRGPRLSKPIC